MKHEDRPTVIIAQPDDVLGFLLEQVCLNSGYNVVGRAHLAADALRLIEKRRPDIMIHDFNYPDGSNGLQLIARARLRHPGLRTVLLTGVDINEIAARPEQSRPDRVLRAPVPMALVADTLGGLAPVERTRLCA